MKTKNAALPLRLVIVGHVDHGKSTLIGRLLHDTGSLVEGKFEHISESCKRRGMPFEWAFLTDALQVERDQNITIDTTQIYLRGKKRDTMIVDAPGHREFLKNMITGAASADAALLIIDVREGVSQQSCTHALLLQLLGTRQVAVIINKMDVVEYEQKKFKAVADEFSEYLKALGITPMHIIPASARAGDNIATTSKAMPWYKGPTVLEALEGFKETTGAESLPLRFPVQDVYKSGDKRIIVGRVEAGTMKIGDTLLFSPSNVTAKIATFENWGDAMQQTQAVAGQSIGLTLDTPVFVERGHVASHEKDAPFLTNVLRTRLFWLGREPLAAGDTCLLKISTVETQAEIKIIERSIDAMSLATADADSVAYGSVADVVMRTRAQIAVDDIHKQPALSRFVLVTGTEISGGGIINTEGLYDQRAAYKSRAKSQNVTSVDYGIAPQARAAKNGHFGGVLWFTGLSGAGKSTIAKLAHKQLFDMGCQVFVLDGDNIRQGLNRDLGFEAADRKENIRRVAEVAALFAQAGIIVLAAFISPYREDREIARAIASNDFHSVYVKASIETCEKRDSKGLYKKARAGKIAEFTGVSAPYEEPETPDIVLDTEAISASACAEMLVSYVRGHLIDPAKNLGQQT